MAEGLCALPEHGPPDDSRGMTARIVVGVDGSTESARALEWALAEAALRGGQVQVIGAYHVPVVAADPMGMAGAYVAPEQVEADTRAVLEEVVAKARQASGHSDVEVVVSVSLGAPRDLLVEASQGAELVVVGARGLGRLGQLVLGSVSQYVATHAGCPVVVVHG